MSNPKVSLSKYKKFARKGFIVGLPVTKAEYFRQKRIKAKLREEGYNIDAYNDNLRTFVEHLHRQLERDLKISPLNKRAGR